MIISRKKIPNQVNLKLEKVQLNDLSDNEAEYLFYHTYLDNFNEGVKKIELLRESKQYEVTQYRPKYIKKLALLCKEKSLRAIKKKTL